MSRFATDVSGLADISVRPVYDEAGEHPALLHVTWRLTDATRVVRIHLDGALAEVASDPAMREAWIVCDRRLPHAVALSTFPREQAHDAWVMQPNPVAPLAPACSSAGHFSFIADQSLPLDAQLCISIDGDIHTTTPLWRADGPRAGLGSLLGQGALGIDGLMCRGLGQGQLGAGPCGVDGDALEFALPILPAGAHNIALRTTDADGAPIGPPITFTYNAVG
jgi:hypothetical protein